MTHTCKSIVILLLFVAVVLTSCAQESADKDSVITIRTKYGDMIAILYDETPQHKANFIKLAKEHYFDGTIFHRVIKEFMIQGGDPDSKTAKPGTRLGNGGPGYTIPAEINSSLFHEKGALSAARMGDEVNPTKASSGSQFYIVQGHKAMKYEIEGLKIDNQKLGEGLRKFVSDPANSAVKDSLIHYQMANDADGFQEMLLTLIPRIEKSQGIRITREVSPDVIKAYTELGGAPHLDGQYTVFGKVIKGLDIIDKIAIVPTDETDRPREDIPMTITVDEMPKSKITKEYGYVYPAKK